MRQWTKTPKENDSENKIEAETNEDAVNDGNVETGGEKKEELREDESTTTE